MEKIKYYCFNKKCESSIFNTDSCAILEVYLEDDLKESYFCKECAKELVSKHVLSIKIQLNEMLNEEQLHKSSSIDDAPGYYFYEKKLLNS